MAKTKKIYFDALETLKQNILNGEYPLNSKLPSESELSEKLNVSVSTLRKILDALRQEGLIETHKGSGSFVCNKTVNRHIPVLVCTLDSSFRFAELLQGIQDFFSKVGFVSSPKINDSNPQKEVELITNLIKEGHKNFIIWPLSSVSNNTFYQNIMRQGVNLTFVDTLPSYITCDYVSSCNFLGGYMATKKLIDLGHKKIAFCCFGDPTNTNTINDRFHGYISAFKQNNIQIDEKNIVTNLSRVHEENIDNFIKTTEATAIFAANDELAIALYKKYRNFTNPPAIIGFDNLTFSNTLSLASVDQQYYKIGEIAAELLYKRILNPDKNYESIQVPVSIVERESLYFDKKNN